MIQLTLEITLIFLTKLTSSKTEQIRRFHRTPQRLYRREQFRETLTGLLRKEPQGSRGRPLFEYVMMFKISILQWLYNISDAQVECQIKDRLSFMKYITGIRIV